MNVLKWIIAVAVSGLFSTVLAAQSGGVTVSHYEPLQRISFQAADAMTGQKPQGTGPVALSFDALGQMFDFQLEPNSGLLSPASRAALPEGIGIYRGRLAGNPESWARIVVLEGIPRGVFWDGEHMYAIEAPGDSVVQATSPIIYRLADTFIEPGTMSCGSESLSGNGATMYGKLVGELGVVVAQAPGAVSEISIGAVGDFEFTSARGDVVAAAAAIAARINTVDGIYSQEIGVQINVPLIETFSDAADPFTDESNAGALLVELLTYRQNTPAQNSLGLTHLYTGRDLDGSTVGVAFDNVLCRSDAGAGLSEGNSSVIFDSLVAAHEIGHNFGAPHDGETGGVCESEPLDFIMAPILNSSTQFSQCTISIMQANAARASCVTALPTVDMSIALNGQPAVVLLGNSPELTVDLNNKGASQATNVAADITLPNNVTLVSATASSGSCSSGAGTVNCQLGDIPGLSGRTVTLTTTASAVGVGILDATVTSDFDERAGNNQATVQFTVDPAVDLAINSPPAATINLDQSTTIDAVLENLSILDATSVTLTIALNNGLRADSASWSIGSCTVAAQQVDCQAANFTSQSSSTLSVSVTGLTAGIRGYIATLSSSEADTDTVNNSVNATITVNDPSDEGGGGVVGLSVLWLLLLGALVSRRRETVVTA
jgi:uncharacterized repeat protein (TIGR01451 family)